MFEDLIGNERAKESLGRMLGTGRVANALLFAGPEGVGKKAFALELARSFVCQRPASGAACGDCGACVRAVTFDIPTSEKKEDFERVIFSSHPDVGLVLPYKQNIAIGAIRDLEREANFRPFEARSRFFVIDEADKMRDAASNALLKTLEEPPAASHIILVTSRPDSLLQTIRSRCQMVRFAPVPADEIETYLIAAGRFSPEDARLAASLSAGSVGRAAGTDPEDIRLRRGRMIEVLESILVRRDRAALLSVSEAMADAKNKDNFDADLVILESLIHDLWTLKLTGDKGDLASADLAAHLARLAANADAGELSGWLRGIEELRERTEVNINKRIATDALFMEMTSSPRK